MKLLFRSTSALMLIIAFGLGQAQSAPQSSRAAALSGYDVRDEQVLAGTVAVLVARQSPGMLPGSHLLLTTTNGLVDVSLGGFAFQGKDALSVAAGEQIEVTGVMRTFGGRSVLLARIVTVLNHSYAIRNEHGIPVTPKARERASGKPQDQETR